MGTPSASAAAGQPDWTRVQLPNSGRSDRIAGAVAIPGGFVIVGDVDRRPMAWSSTDGISWVAEPLTGHGPLPVDAAAYRGGVLAIGAGEDGECAHPAGEDAWVRDGSGHWTEAPIQDLFCAG